MDEEAAQETEGNSKEWYRILELAVTSSRPEHAKEGAISGTQKGQWSRQGRLAGAAPFREGKQPRRKLGE